MPPTITNLTSGDSAADQSSAYSTAAVAATSGNVVVLSVVIQHASALPGQPTIAGGGVTTWNLRRFSGYDNAGSTRCGLWVFWGVSNGSSAAITITPAGAEQGCCWSVEQIASGDPSAPFTGTDVEAIVTATSNTVTHAAMATNARPFAVVAHVTGGLVINPRTNWSELADVGTENKRLETQWRSDTAEATGSATWGSTSLCVIMVFEVAPATSVITLAVQDASHAHAADIVPLGVDYGLIPRAEEATAVDGSSMTTQSVVIGGSGAILTVFGGTSGATGNTPTVAGWTMLGVVGDTRKVTTFYRAGTFVGTATIDWGGQTQSYRGYCISDAYGYDFADLEVQEDSVEHITSFVTTTSGEPLALSTFANPTNTVYLALFHGGGSPNLTTFDAGMIELQNRDIAAESMSMGVAWNDAEDLQPDGSWANAGHYVTHAFELRRTVSAVTLVVQDATHGHTSDGAALVQQHALAVQDATHAHAADQVTLSLGAITLVVQEALHTTTSDVPILVQAHMLVVQEAAHAHASDALTLTQLHVLAVQDARSTHASDPATLTQLHILAVQDALHTHAADTLGSFPGGTSLIVQEATHAHSSDAPALTQAHTLVVQDSTHAHSSDALALIQSHVLVVQDARSLHASDPVTLVLGTLTLAVQDGLHAHASDVPAFTQLHQLVVQEARSLHAADTLPTFPSGSILVVQDALHTSTSDVPILTQAHALSVQDALHSSSADTRALVQAHVLVVQDGRSTHIADVISLGGSSFLIVQDARHLHAAENVGIGLAPTQVFERSDDGMVLVTPGAHVRHGTPRARTVTARTGEVA